jgi:hypothetical protein
MVFSVVVSGIGTLPSSGTAVGSNDAVSWAEPFCTEDDEGAASLSRTMPAPATAPTTSTTAVMNAAMTPKTRNSEG